MTWVALADRRGGWAHSAGLDCLVRGIADPGTRPPIVSGTLLIEFRIPSTSRDRLLLSARGPEKSATGITLGIDRNGTLLAQQSDGVSQAQVAIDLNLPERTDVIRTALSWDAQSSRLRLAVDIPGRNGFRMADAKGALPMKWTDVLAIGACRGARHMHRSVLFAAVSDRPKPAGPLPAMAVDTPVLTATGYRRLDDLKRGDLVMTPQGDLVPVLAVLFRRMPARGGSAPLRLRSPYLGLRQDIVMAREQRLVLRGSQVEYLFGHEAVLVAAEHLVAGGAAVPVKGKLEMDYAQLLLPGHEAAICAGLPVETFYAGRLKRHPHRLAATQLAEIEKPFLPEHRQPSYPVLRPYEAVALAHYRAA